MATAATGGHKFPEGRHVLRLGDSFFAKTAPSYHTMRYDFKPASVGDCKETFVEVAENQEVTVTVPKLDETGEVKDATIFKGPRKQYQKECLLIYDHETGEFVLEQLTFNIQLKKTRGEVTHDLLQNIKETRKTLLQSAGPDLNAADTRSLQEHGTAGNDGGGGGRANEADTEFMSDSEGSRSDSDSSDEGDDAGDINLEAALNGTDGALSEDELAKTLEAELSSDQHSGVANEGAPATAHNRNVESGSQQNASQPSRLHEDLLLSESSDDDDDDDD